MFLDNLPSQSTHYRISGALLALTCSMMGPISVYWIATLIQPIYKNLWHHTHMVEVQYMAFGLIGAPSILLYGITGGLYAALTGKRFAPKSKSWLGRFEYSMLWITACALIALTPLAALSTTAALKLQHYESCPALRKSGSSWQTFWVSNPDFCFTPDRFTEDDRPCKTQHGHDMCL